MIQKHSISKTYKFSPELDSLEMGEPIQNSSIFHGDPWLGGPRVRAKLGTTSTAASAAAVASGTRKVAR